MDHIALDRARAYDRHLDHQVIEFGGLDPRQHRHLRARFDLEHAHGVGQADHVVGVHVLGRDRGQLEIAAAMPAHQRQRLADAGQHAQRQAVDLEQPHRLQVVLVPLDDGAVGHRRVLHRHHGGQRRIGNDEAADMLGKMARMITQHLGDRQHARYQRILQIETGFLQALLHRRIAIAPAIAVGQQRDLVRRQAERLGHVAHRALAAIADHGGGQRRARAAVLVVDVLQHFLAALVLEVHVDVRRFVACLGQEARDQQAVLGRIHRGDAQRVAHRRIGRGTAALAEDLARFRETHDVVHGEEERLVLQLGDQRQLLLDIGHHLVRHAFGPACPHAGFGEFTQVAGQRMPRRHQLGRIAVCQVALEIEAAATPRQFDRGLQQRRRMDVAQRAAAAQVALAVAEQMRAALGQRQVVADRGQRVLHDAIAAPRHVHIATGHRHQRQLPRQCQQLRQPRGVIAFAMQFHRQVGALAEQRAQPLSVRDIGLGGRQPQREQARRGVAQHRLDIDAQQAVAALGHGAARAGDQFAQLRVAARVLHQQHHARAVGQRDLAADHQRQAGRARRLPAAHDAGQRAFVGDRQRFVAAFARTGEQRLGRRCATQEREVRQAVQLGIGRQAGIALVADFVVGRRAQARIHRPCPGRAPARGVALHAVVAVIPAHANHPCSIQPSRAPGAT